MMNTCEDLPPFETKCHIGCGSRDFGPGWINIDGKWHPHVHHVIEDLKKLPYSCNHFELIYASHVIEYFDQFEIVTILEEWKRVLKPGGILRLAVPDFKMMARLYFTGEPLFRFIGPLFGRMEMDKKMIYHKCVYDIDSLISLLESSGFSDIQEWDWRKVDHGKFDDHSQAYIPHMDKENGVLISLNLQCKK